VLGAQLSSQSLFPRKGLVRSRRGKREIGMPDELVEEVAQIEELVAANEAILNRLDHDSPRLDAAWARKQKQIRRELARLSPA
jgi:hypothetical protein